MKGSRLSVWNKVMGERLKLGQLTSATMGSWRKTGTHFAPNAQEIYDDIYIFTHFVFSFSSLSSPRPSMLSF